MAQQGTTRERIMNTAQEAVLAKGFDATSIDEIVSAVEITKGGFFYHFPDKNALAVALIQRYIDDENKLFDDIFGRARDLSDDPLHRMLIALKLLAEVLDDLPNGHPGCVIASAAYQDRLFNSDVRRVNEEAVAAWRRRFSLMFEEIAQLYPPREAVDLRELADMLSGVVEGGIILSKVYHDPKSLVRQVMIYRSFVKLLFSPVPG